MQRARLLNAVVLAVDELGWSDVTVADITGRARVSRRTFYDVFANREECLLAVLNDATERIERDLVAATVDASCWVERVRKGLWEILCSLDRDPVLARVWVVESGRGTQRVLEARQALLARLTSAIAAGDRARAGQVPSLVAEGLVGAAVAIVYKRLLQREPAPLRDLQGELMAMIVLPYLGSVAASRECKRSAPEPGRHVDVGLSRHAASTGQEDALRGVPMRLTYRTARVLSAIAQAPGASNRLVAERAGVCDQGQVSKLLARLRRIGLLENAGDGQTKGEQNAWHLSPLGERVTEQIVLATKLERDAA
jgi:AcrR family transcriptional regulator/DNA-binding MarR family transcriptional regulator